MNAPTRIECLIAAAYALTNIAEQNGNNRGQMVELFLRGVGLPAGSPWCAAFVHHVGYWSQFDPDAHESAWPLPATGSCQQLGNSAIYHNVLSKTPTRGDIFLLYIPSAGRFAHTGIILDVRETSTAFVCMTVEGNTNDDGSPDGWKSCIKHRVFFKNDRHAFIRWITLVDAPAMSAASNIPSLHPPLTKAA